MLVLQWGVVTAMRFLPSESDFTIVSHVSGRELFCLYLHASLQFANCVAVPPALPTEAGINMPKPTSGDADQVKIIH